MTYPWLLSWNWRLDILLPGLALAFGYLLGWFRLQFRRGSKRQVRRRSKDMAIWRPLAYLLGLISLFLAVMSPIDVLSQQLFSMHMIQHLLLVMIAPPLILLANPFPSLLWGLPRFGRALIVYLLRARAPFRLVLRRLTNPWLTALYFVGLLWLWHWPVAYEAALQSEFVHDLEHLSFFVSALLFWWPVTQAAPHIRPGLPYVQRIAYVLLTLPFSLGLGLLIAFASSPIYPHYTTVPRLWKLSVMQDQALGGTIMWVPGSMMYIIAAFVLFRLMLQEEGRI